MFKDIPQASAVFTEPEEPHMREFLKIKICSLAAEARIIRNRERKFKKHRYLKQRKAAEKSNESQQVLNPKYRPLPASLEACNGDPREIDRFNTFWGLRNHRMELRKESRASGIAYGFLRNKPYRRIEAKAYTKPNWDLVEKTASRFGNKKDMEGFTAWKDAATAK
jgi:hypothetical protein